MNSSTSDKTAKGARTGAIVATLLRDRGLRLYGAATLLGAPLWLVKKWRLKRYLKLECEFDPARWTSRFPAKLDAQPKRANPSAKGPRVMFFTPGWGDVATMKPLIEALRAARPNARLLFTTKHHEAIVPASQLSDEAVAPLPFDNPLSVARWLAATQPDLVIFYERFLYATLLRSLWLQSVPFVIVHARMSARRANNRSSPNLKFKSWQLRGLRDILLPTPDYLPGTRAIAPAEARLHVVGSIKFPHQKPQIAPERAAELQAWIEAGTAGAPLIVAGSTHETEEEFVLDAWEKTRANVPKNAPVLLLAPRKPYRTDEVLQLLRKRGLGVSRRSQWEKEAARQSVDVLLLDTLGELGAAYAYAMGAFVGGTLSADAHNVAEPLIWKVPVAYGPRRGNFGVEQTLCEAAGVGFRVETPEELAAHWTSLLQSPALRAELARKSDKLIEDQSDAFERILQILIDAVDAVTN